MPSLAHVAARAGNFRPRRRPEDDLQMAVASWLTVQRPDCLWYHVPNGGWRSKAESGRFKAMGVRAGVLDIPFVLNGGQAAFIELKVGNNPTSDEQDDFIRQAEALGALTAVCYSLDDVIETLKRWGVTWAGQKR